MNKKKRSRLFKIKPENSIRRMFRLAHKDLSVRIPQGSGIHRKCLQNQVDKYIRRPSYMITLGIQDLSLTNPPTQKASIYLINFQALYFNMHSKQMYF